MCEKTRVPGGNLLPINEIIPLQQHKYYNSIHCADTVDIEYQPKSMTTVLPEKGQFYMMVNSIHRTGSLLYKTSKNIFDNLIQINSRYGKNLTTRTDLQIWYMDKLPILVLGQYCDESRPTTAEVLLAVHQLTMCRIQVWIRL